MNTQNQQEKLVQLDNLQAITKEWSRGERVPFPRYKEKDILHYHYCENCDGIGERVVCMECYRYIKKKAYGWRKWLKDKII